MQIQSMPSYALRPFNTKPVRFGNKTADEQVKEDIETFLKKQKVPFDFVDVYGKYIDINIEDAFSISSAREAVSRMPGCQQHPQKKDILLYKGYEIKIEL